MLKRFVRLFGGAKHGEKQEWLNSRIACAVMAAVCLLFSLMPVLREISSGMRVIILTVGIAAMAAWLAPVKEDA